MKLRLVHVLALGASAVLAASALSWPAALEGVELCPFHAWSGLPCPGCGLTHAFRALAHGDLAAAWAANPFGLPLFLLTLALASAPFWPRAAERLARSRAVSVGAVGLALGLVAFGTLRIVHQLQGS